MKPKVSVILPIYCVEKFLERCLKSVTEQTLRDIEIILVDDGSLDNCPVMCDNYGKLDRRIKVIHKKNEGLGYARNTGLDYATGEYVAFIDSDDFIDINMMNQLYTYAYKYDLDAVFCGMKFVDAHGNITMDRKEVNEYIEMKGNECRQHVLDLIASREKSRVSSKYMMSVWHAIYHKEFLDKHNIRFCSERDFISEDMIFDIDFFFFFF